ncbi:MAG TPA: dTDP-4-dehydrorhamnose 3,5-epimerase [Candidatus Cybelea sp.]
MTVENLPLSGALVLTASIFTDDRGSFRELFSLDRYRECGIRDSFVQDNSSLSRRNVLRGLHGAVRMSKIVSVLHGSAYDVIVDVRPESPTYRRWYGTTLSAGDGRQLYIPSGCLHGFLALEDRTIFWYKQSAPYDAAAEFAVAWNDAELGIDWPLNGTAPVLSARDAGNPPLGSLRA